MGDSPQGVGDASNLAVHSKKLDELVRPRRHAAAVRQLLAEGGYTLPGKEGRFVSQLKVKGFGPSASPILSGYGVTGCRNELVMWPGVGQPTVLSKFTISNISLTRFSIKKIVISLKGSLQSVRPESTLVSL